MDDEFQPLECPNCESLVRLVQKRSVVDGNFRAASYCEHGAKALKAHITAKSPSGGKSMFARMTTKRGKPIADIQHNGKCVRVGLRIGTTSLSTTKRCPKCCLRRRNHALAYQCDA